MQNLQEETMKTAEDLGGGKVWVGRRWFGPHNIGLGDELYTTDPFHGCLYIEEKDDEKSGEKKYRLVYKGMLWDDDNLTSKNPRQVEKVKGYIADSCTHMTQYLSACLAAHPGYWEPRKKDALKYMALLTRLSDEIGAEDSKELIKKTQKKWEEERKKTEEIWKEGAEEALVRAASALQRVGCYMVSLGKSGLMVPPETTRLLSSTLGNLDKLRESIPTSPESCDVRVAEDSKKLIEEIQKKWGGPEKERQEAMRNGAREALKNASSALQYVRCYMLDLEELRTGKPGGKRTVELFRDMLEKLDELGKNIDTLKKRRIRRGHPKAPSLSDLLRSGIATRAKLMPERNNTGGLNGGKGR